MDEREEHSAGYKFNEWEIQGIPLRIELGPRDLAAGVCVLARRDRVKTTVKLEAVVNESKRVLEEFQQALYNKAASFLKENTFSENDYAKFKELIETKPGFYEMHWCGKDACELAVKEETKATIRCVPFQQKKESGKCIKCDGPSGGRVIFARNY